MRASILFGLFIVAGCSSKVVEPDPVSNVEGARTLDSLSAAEAEQYCLDVTAYTKKATDAFDSKRFGCAMVAPVMASGTKTDAEAVAACRKGFDDCLARPAESPKPSTDASSCKTAYTDLQKCKGTGTTVGDLNGCVSESRAQLQTLASIDPCATVKAGGSAVPAKEPEMGSGANCTALKAKCPAAFADKTSGSGTPPSGP